MTRLIAGPWETVFQELVDSVAEELVIVSPFIGREPVSWLCELLRQNGRAARVRLRCLTNVSPTAIAGGGLEVSALLTLVRQGFPAQVVHLGNLHAKVYVADERAAIVTSANFTLGGFRRNREMGVYLDSPEVVHEIRHHLEGLFRVGTRLHIEDLETLATLERQLRAQEPPRQAEASESLQAVQTQLMKARLRMAQARAQRDRRRRATVHPQSENHIFAETILYLLSRHGPMTTAQLHPLIQNLHPELCDDAVDRVIDGVHFGKRWKHMVRNAQQYLKRSGKIGYDPQRRLWFLRPEEIRDEEQ